MSVRRGSTVIIIDMRRRFVQPLLFHTCFLGSTMRKTRVGLKLARVEGDRVRACAILHSEQYFYLKCHVEQESIIAEGSDDRLRARSNVFIHSLHSPSTVSQYILSPVYLSGG